MPVPPNSPLHKLNSSVSVKTDSDGDEVFLRPADVRALYEAAK